MEVQSAEHDQGLRPRPRGHWPVISLLNLRSGFFEQACKHSRVALWIPQEEVEVIKWHELHQIEPTKVRVPRAS